MNDDESSVDPTFAPSPAAPRTTSSEMRRLWATSDVEVIWVTAARTMVGVG